MATNLRQLSDRDRQIINRYSAQAQHGRVLRSEVQIADNSGGIGVPLIRLSSLAMLERRGRITSQEAAAGEQFNRLFQVAGLDGLRAADMSRTPVAGGPIFGDISDRSDRCRKRVADAMAILGGNSSIAASVIWHVCGLEWPVSRWSLTVRRSHEQGAGILIGALGALAAHFGRRR